MHQNEPNFESLYQLDYNMDFKKIANYFSLFYNKAIQRWRIVNMRSEFQSLNAYKCNLFTLLQNEYYETLRVDAKQIKSLLVEEERFPLKYKIRIDDEDSVPGKYMVLNAKWYWNSQEEDHPDGDRQSHLWRTRYFKEYLQYITASVSIVILYVMHHNPNRVEKQYESLFAFKLKDKKGKEKFILPWTRRTTEIFSCVKVVPHTTKLRQHQQVIENFPEDIWEEELIVYAQPLPILSSYKTELTAMIDLSSDNVYARLIATPREIENGFRILKPYGQQISQVMENMNEIQYFIDSFDREQHRAINDAVDFQKYVIQIQIQITFIDGPPGTGKTQTSLGIISVFAEQMIQNGENNDIILALGHSNTVVNDFVRKISKAITQSPSIFYISKDTCPLKLIRAGRPDKCEEDIVPYSLEILSQIEFYNNYLSLDLKNFLRSLRDSQQRQIFQQDQFNLIKFLEYIENYSRQVRIDEKWMTRIEQVYGEMNQLLATFSESYETIQLGFLGQKNVIVSTLNSCASNILTTYLRTKNIRICIVDEAPTASESALLIPLANYQIDKLVLLGDVKQLGIVCSSKQSKDYGFDQSTYQRLINFGLEKIRLLYQYRQMPNLAKITSMYFYKDQLICPNGNMAFPPDYAHLINEKNNSLFFNIVHGTEIKDDNNSKFNILEADAIIRLVQYLCQNTIQYLNKNPNLKINKEISIIVAYRGQHKVIKEKLRSKNLLRLVELDTIDSFQGKENLFVIISLVGQSKMGFIGNQKRCNVALSRAQYGQFIFGNLKLLENWKLNIWKDILKLFKAEKWIKQYDLQASINEKYFEEVLKA